MITSKRNRDLVERASSAAGRSPHADHFRHSPPGHTPKLFATSCERIGVAKADNLVEMASRILHPRRPQDEAVPRLMTVIDPIKVVLTNYPDGQTETMKADNNQENEAVTRDMTFSKHLYTSNEATSWKNRSRNSSAWLR